MKGRLYDPELGRFIQADDVVEPDATQGLNRYTYVLNNPLSLTYPTGHLSTRQWIGLAIAVIASYFSYGLYSTSAWASFSVAVAGGFASAYVATGSWRAGLWGAFAAGVFWGIGTGFNSIRGEAGTGVFGSGFTSGQYAAKVAAHGSAGGVLAELQGGNFGSGFLAAGATEAVSPAIDTMPKPGQFIASAVVGGTVSEATGGTFANGAVTAAFQFLFNSTIHELEQKRQQSLAQRMQGKFLNDGTSGVTINLFDRYEDLYYFAEDFPEIAGVKIIAGHSDPSKSYMRDHTNVVEREYTPTRAALDLIAAGLKSGEQVLVLGCGAGTSGFASALHSKLRSLGFINSVTGPTGLTTFGTIQYTYRNSTQTYTFFPSFSSSHQSNGPGSRVNWVTVGED